MNLQRLQHSARRRVRGAKLLQLSLARLDRGDLLVQVVDFLLKFLNLRGEELNLGAAVGRNRNRHACRALHDQGSRQRGLGENLVSLRQLRELLQTKDRLEQLSLFDDFLKHQLLLNLRTAHGDACDQLDGNRMGDLRCLAGSGFQFGRRKSLKKNGQCSPLCLLVEFDSELRFSGHGLFRHSVPRQVELCLRLGRVFEQRLVRRFRHRRERPGDLVARNGRSRRRDS